MFLKCYDASPEPENLTAMVGAKLGIDYMYQVEQWIQDTKDHAGVDGPIVRWDLIEGTISAPGPLIRQWARQPDNSIKEVQVVTGPYAVN